MSRPRKTREKSSKTKIIEKKLDRLVVCNWKMNPTTFLEADRAFEMVRNASARLKRTNVVVCPPTLYLEGLSSLYKGKKIQFGIQDAWHEDNGAWTGETSFLQAAQVGTSYAIINHSERKKRGEDRVMAKKKLESALRNGLTAVVCVGEENRSESGKHFSDVFQEIVFFLSGLTDDKRARIVLAYEPIWAIGKKGSQAATPHDLHEMSLYIRKVLIDGMGERSAYSVPLLYGGSVDSTNAGSLVLTGSISGFLLGRASLVEKDLTAILSALENE